METNTVFLALLFGMYLVFCGVLYYIIFRKHHKKNKIELFELITLVSKFFATTTITLIVIALGIKCIISANEYKDNRFDVITYLSFGIFIISMSIINYIFYIKRSLVDLNPEVREANKKATIKVSEILEIIIFTIMLLMPIWKIPAFIELWSNKKDVILEILKSFGVSICSIILMYNLNPLKIRDKIFKK